MRVYLVGTEQWLHINMYIYIYIHIINDNRQTQLYAAMRRHVLLMVPHVICWWVVVANASSPGGSAALDISPIAETEKSHALYRSMIVSGFKTPPRTLAHECVLAYLWPCLGGWS
jgi:hypothetical protein